MSKEAVARYRKKYPERYRARLRQWRAENREKETATRRRYREKYPEKARAHDAVRSAVRNGTLIRQQCEQFGDDCRGNVQAHHEDYSKPLDVRWLCREHHRRVHQ